MAALRKTNSYAASTWDRLDSVNATDDDDNVSVEDTCFCCNCNCSMNRSANLSGVTAETS